MKSVLISIKPKYCELIASGKKTIEVRKTRPNIEAPFKCYIYMTKKFYRKGDGYFQGRCCGKVIGEFVCDEIYEAHYETIAGLCGFNLGWGKDEDCITDDEIEEYAGEADTLYGWHISDLKIYDEPKELSNFCKIGFEDDYAQWEDSHIIGVRGIPCVEYAGEPKLEDYQIKRPPQSWCYVEEIV